MDLKQPSILTSIAALCAVAVLLVDSIAPGAAAECPREGVLGTFRVLKVDAAAYPRVGLKSFPQTLPLRDKEVVLTFDDGPSPTTTPKVLDALAQECVRATFFLIGQHAAAHPELVRRIAAEGHSIGYHTWSHRSLKRIPQNQAPEEIDRGIAAVEKALHGVRLRSRRRRSSAFPAWSRRQKRSASCNRARSSCSVPIYGPATGTR